MTAADFNKAHGEYVSVSLTDYGVIELVGEQSEQFLQGQLTNDLRQLSTTRYLYAAHCDNKGKALALFYVCKIANSILLISSRAALAVSLPQLQKFAVFSKTTLRDASADYPLQALFGAATPQRAAQWLGQPLSVAEEDALSVVGERAVLQLSADAYLLVGMPALPSNADVSVWQRWQIEHGRASLESATIGEFVPQMLNVQLLNGISFTKGCYIGQETIARMKYLGKQKRALFRLHGRGLPTIAGTVVEQQLGANWRTAGTVINAVSRADQTLDILAVLPSDIEASTALRIKDDDASFLEIYPLPYSLEAS